MNEVESVHGFERRMIPGFIEVENEFGYLTLMRVGAISVVQPLPCDTGTRVTFFDDDRQIYIRESYEEVLDLIEKAVK